MHIYVSFFKIDRVYERFPYENDIILIDFIKKMTLNNGKNCEWKVNEFVLVINC